MSQNTYINLPKEALKKNLKEYGNRIKKHTSYKNLSK